MVLARMSVAGLDSSPETSCFAALLGMDEAESEAIGKDATLRELVWLWSTLEQSVQDAIIAIVRSLARE